VGGKVGVDREGGAFWRMGSFAVIGVGALGYPRELCLTADGEAISSTLLILFWLTKYVVLSYCAYCYALCTRTCYTTRSAHVLCTIYDVRTPKSSATTNHEPAFARIVRLSSSHASSSHITRQVSSPQTMSPHASPPLLTRSEKPSTALAQPVRLPPSRGSLRGPADVLSWHGHHSLFAIPAAAWRTRVKIHVSCATADT